MIDVRPILLVIGILLTTLGCAMLLPALVDAAVANPDWQIFLVSAGVTLFTGIGLTLTNWGYNRDLNLQQAFLLTTLSWVALAAFAALPLAFSELNLSVADAFFESMSGLTTTGSTVITGLDHAPPGILLWRALLQWLGGVGIIVMAIAVLPMLQIGGMQLFRMESSDTSEKILPRATQIAGAITAIYAGISFLCAFLYWLAGMNAFDAIIHAMTTIATGGFSTKDDSIGHFDSAAVNTVAVVFMCLGALPFALYLHVVRGNIMNLLRDTQVQWFFITAAALVVVLTVYQVFEQINQPVAAFDHAALNVVSVLTGTGFASTDYGLWGGFATGAFFTIMFIGGCAGSASCGIKIFRFQVLFAATFVHIKRIIYPHGVFVPKYNGRAISDSVSASVMSFLFLFLLCFGVIACALDLLGLDYLTAFSAAATAITNVGPGLGPIVGPEGNFSTLPDAAKWILSIGMLLGRLELFTVLVLFIPSFWRH